MISRTFSINILLPFVLIQLSELFPRALMLEVVLLGDKMVCSKACCQGRKEASKEFKLRSQSLGLRGVCSNQPETTLR